MQAPSLPSQRINTFQQRVAKIEAAFADGDLTPSARRRLLELARDEIGVKALVSPEYRVPIDSIRTDEEVRERRREVDRRRRGRKTISPTTLAAQAGQSA